MSIDPAIAKEAQRIFDHAGGRALRAYRLLCAMLDPNDWSGKVQTQKVTLAEARGDWDALFRAAVDREVNRLKNESLPSKIDVLQAVCQPGSGEMLKGYAYDAARLKEIDQYRHASVHKRVDPPPFDVIDTIAVMERTQVYLSVLVTHRHGLKLGPDAMNVRVLNHYGFCQLFAFCSPTGLP